MNDNLMVSTRKGLFLWRRDGASWKIDRTAFLADNVTLALVDQRDGAIYAALNHGHFGVKLHRSEDRGQTWREIAAPAYPKAEGAIAEAAQPAPGGDAAPTVTLIWSLEAGGPDQPGLLWAGTLPGGLFRSNDRGESWSLIQSLWDDPKRKEWFGGGAEKPGIHSISLDPRNSRRLLVGVSCGGVWGSDDGGETWDCRANGMVAEYMPPERQGDPNIQDPHRLVRCPAAPDTLWVQHHNGIFLSTDESKSWTRVQNNTASSFGFAVVVHPREPKTAWFIPGIKDEKRIPADGKLVVTRTRDGGRSFEVLKQGLPHEHAYDLVFRHALDIDDSGDRLAFGSTTGNLWVSENQGDSWSSLSMTLPPIYAVRFF